MRGDGHPVQGHEAQALHPRRGQGGGAPRHRRLPRSKLVSDDDSLVLEDEGARVRLTGKGVAVDCSVTGVVLAVKGRVVANGEFEVDEICYPHQRRRRPDRAQLTRPRPRGATQPALGPARRGRRRVLRAQPRAHVRLRHRQPRRRQRARRRRVHRSRGHLRRRATRGGRPRRVPRRPRAGGGCPAPALRSTSSPPRSRRRFPSTRCPATVIPRTRRFPSSRFTRASSCEAKRFSPHTFASCTNPHDFTIGGVDFLGTAGQNVSNLRRTRTSSRASRAAKKAKGGEEALDPDGGYRSVAARAPSAPDTLACYPYKDRDPFFIERSPHVYFRRDAARVRVQEGEGG